MKKERFYYTPDLKLGTLDVLLTNDNTIVASGNTLFTGAIPRATICGIYDDEEHTMTYGVARCSHKDTFRREVGRELSFNRALHAPYKVVKIHQTQKVSDVFIENARIIEEEVLAATYPMKFNN